MNIIYYMGMKYQNSYYKIESIIYPYLIAKHLFKGMIHFIKSMLMSWFKLA